VWICEKCKCTVEKPAYYKNGSGVHVGHPHWYSIAVPVCDKGHLLISDSFSRGLMFGIWSTAAILFGAWAVAAGLSSMQWASPASLVFLILFGVAFLVAVFVYWRRAEPIKRLAWYFCGVAVGIWAVLVFGFLSLPR
jgi:hypothetical protein